MVQLYGPNKDWSGDDLVRLFAMSTLNMRKTLSYIANQPPNRRVPLREVSEAVFEGGTDPNLRRISGTLKGLTVNSQQIRGRESEVWPIFHDPDGESGGFEYWMDAATAAQFLQISRGFYL